MNILEEAGQEVDPRLKEMSYLSGFNKSKRGGFRGGRGGGGFRGRGQSDNRFAPY